MYDGAQGGAWTGDIGYACGQHWYYGNQEAGTMPDCSSYKPYCTWLDGDATNGIPSASLKFTSEAYGTNVQDTNNNGLDCSATIFTKNTGPISDAPNSKSSKREAGAFRVRPTSTEDRLIISKNAGHTAQHLCNHPTSLGPDFVGADEYFCDMSTKALSPLCSTEQQDGCVNVSANRTITMRSSVARRSVDFVHTTYGSITYWD